MKTTLIIFLFLISILIYIVAFFKIKVEYELIIKNNLLIIKRIILKKEKRKEIKVTVDNLIDKVIEKIELHEKLKDVKLFNFSIQDISEILEIIEIEKLDISLKVGTPFTFCTILFVTFLSSIIPTLYRKTDNRNGKLFYHIEPNFNNFEISGKINLDFKFTILKLIWIKNYLKKSDNKQKTRRRMYDKSSYRRFDEYRYE